MYIPTKLNPTARSPVESNLGVFREVNLRKGNRTSAVIRANGVGCARIRSRCRNKRRTCGIVNRGFVKNIRLNYTVRYGRFFRDKEVVILRTVVYLNRQRFVTCDNIRVGVFCSNACRVCRIFNGYHKSTANVGDTNRTLRTNALTLYIVTADTNQNPRAANPVVRNRFAFGISHYGKVYVPFLNFCLRTDFVVPVRAFVPFHSVHICIAARCVRNSRPYRYEINRIHNDIGIKINRFAVYRPTSKHFTSLFYRRCSHRFTLRGFHGNTVERNGYHNFAFRNHPRIGCRTAYFCNFFIPRTRVRNEFRIRRGRRVGGDFGHFPFFQPSFRQYVAVAVYKLNQIGFNRGFVRCTVFRRAVFGGTFLGRAVFRRAFFRGTFRRRAFRRSAFFGGAFRYGTLYGFRRIGGRACAGEQVTRCHRCAHCKCNYH